MNQTSQEKFGLSLSLSAELIVMALLGNLLKLHKQTIKNPDNIYKYQKYYQDQAQSIAEQFESDWQTWADYDLSYAYLEGLKQADKEIKPSKILKDIALLTGFSMLRGSYNNVPPDLPGTIKMMFKKYPGHISLLNTFRAAVYSNFKNQKFQIVRSWNDIFRRVAIMAGEGNYKDADVFTRRRLSQYMLDEFAKKGIQTITYRNGVKYSIDSYCEMVGRTMTGRAAVQANLSRFWQSGYNLVMVSSHFRACDLCTPYEGRVLSIEQHPIYESVSDAETQGLFHPRCAHDVSAWWEGREIEPVRMHPGEQQLVNQYGYNEAQKISYDAQQKQRYIERNIRNWKRRAGSSLTEKDKRIANKKVREWQAKQRNHLNENTFLPRKYSREQVTRAH